ncbi:MAG: ABC transporter substrate-binding protein, partial [Rhodococcus sp.]|nr:ABC transporter substrate-binding protein [Rhodococcus sp. (in: high G+C Gram-positive bacteria)]
PNVEAVMALEPDLVITMVRADIADKLQVDNLHNMIPTVALEIEEPTDVWDRYPDLAAALGCIEFANAELAGLDEGLESIKTEHADAIADLGPVAYVEGSDEPATYQIATNKSLVYERLQLAGLTYFDGVDPDPKRYVDLVSVEEVDRLSSANVLFYEADADGNPTKRTQELLDSPVFQSLPAVQAGNLFPYRTPYAYTVAAVNRQIADIEAGVEAATPVNR